MTITTSAIKYDQSFTTQTITYSFTSAGRWDGRYQTSPTTFIDSFSGTKTAITFQTIFKTAIDEWNNYSIFNISPSETTESTIAIYNVSDLEPRARVGFMDNVADTTAILNPTNYDYERAETAIKPNVSGLNAKFQLFLSLHEFGHALGLRGDDFFLTNDYTTDMTVMSYNIPDGTTNGVPNTSPDARYAITPMALDIKAIEEKYGASTFNTGDNTYSFVGHEATAREFSGEKRSQTIVDTDGDDTLDVSSYTAGGVSIDLRPAVDSDGNWLGHVTQVGEERIYLAHNTMIERAVGTAQNDTIIGNNADNTLNGGAGNDQLEGGGGTDKYGFATGHDLDVITDGGVDDRLVLDGATIKKAVLAEDAQGNYALKGYTVTHNAGANILTLTKGDDAITLNDWEDGDYGISFQPDYTFHTLNYPTATDYQIFTGTAGVDVVFVQSGRWAIVPSGGDDIYVLTPTPPTSAPNRAELLINLTNPTKTILPNNANINEFVGDQLMIGDALLQGKVPQSLGNFNLQLSPYSGGNTFLGGANAGATFSVYPSDVGDNPNVDARIFGIELPSFAAETVTRQPKAIDASYFSENRLVLEGDDDDNLLTGGNGNDELYALGGNDTVSGGLGNDTLIAGSGTGDDVYEGGAGNDDVTYRSTTLGIVVNLATGVASGAEIDTDSVVSIENIVSGSGNDTISGNAEDNILEGGNGDDILLGDSGNDQLIGGAGNDNLAGDTGNDLILGADGADTLIGAAGVDTLVGGIGNDNLSGGADQDSLSGGDGDDILVGGSENDTLLGDGGSDTLFGDDGNDSLNGGAANDTLFGGAGNDTLNDTNGNNALNGEAGDDSLIGGSGNDSLIGGDGNDTILAGNSGLDTLLGGVGNDSLGSNSYFGTAFMDGGSGNDTVIGGNQNDTLLGGDGDDSITGNGGNDSLNGGVGNNTLNGGAGNDSYLYSGIGQTVIIDNSGIDTLYAGGHTLSELQYSAIMDTDNNTTLDSLVMYFNANALQSDDRSQAIIMRDYNLNTTNRFDVVFDQNNISQATSTSTFGRSTNDTLTGTSGNEVLHGFQGNDVISGAAGNDTALGGTGNDMLEGGADNGVITFGVSPAIQTFNTITYTGGTQAVNVADVANQGNILEVTARSLTANQITFLGRLPDGDALYRVNNGSENTVNWVLNNTSNGGVDFPLSVNANAAVIVNVGNIANGIAFNLQGGGAPASTATSGSALVSLQQTAGSISIDQLIYGDALQGGAGADIFVYGSTTQGVDAISDFEVGVDKLRLTDTLKSSAAIISFDAPNDTTILFHDGNGGYVANAAIVLSNVVVNDFGLLWE